jgi:hypothetical protein
VWQGIEMAADEVLHHLEFHQSRKRGRAQVQQGDEKQ